MSSCLTLVHLHKDDDDDANDDNWVEREKK